MPRHALVYDPHAYQAGATQCACDDDHAPCAVCGSAEGAYIHGDEAAEQNVGLVVLAAGDAASATEAAGVG